MSSANVELVRSILADWERGDYSSAEWADPEIEFDRRDGPDPRVRRGLAAMAQTVGDWLRAWIDVRFTVEKLYRVGEERVLALTWLSGRGRTSGVDLARMQAEVAWLFEVHDQRITRLVYYADHGRALADVGLSRDATPE
jgi:ketosteroid isomerase-like protein